jgi:hypothetical protein
MRLLGWPKVITLSDFRTILGYKKTHILVQAYTTNGPQAAFNLAREAQFFFFFFDSFFP